ncbi:hypothetical protein FQZ97_1076050 [compost metagenome]
MPMAIASTARVNSSREPVPALRSSSQGMTRRPTMTISTIKAMTLPRVISNCTAMLLSVLSPCGVPPSRPERAGSSTRAMTITRSSTISQPTAILPRRLSSN